MGEVRSRQVLRVEVHPGTRVNTRVGGHTHGDRFGVGVTVGVCQGTGRP